MEEFYAPALLLPIHIAHLPVNLTATLNSTGPEGPEDGQQQSCP